MTRELTWHVRNPPRPAVAVLGAHDTAGKLALAVHRRGPDVVELRLAAADGFLLVLGPQELLPWVDGVTYLGTDQGVLLPTTLAPSVPPDLLRRALRGQVGEAQLAVVPGHALVFTSAAGIVDPAWLLDFAQRPAT